LYDNGADLVALPNFSANSISILFSGSSTGGGTGGGGTGGGGSGTGSGNNGGLLPPPGGGGGSGSGSGNNGGLLPPPPTSALNLTGILTGALNIVTGPDNSNINLGTSTIGTARFTTTGAGMDHVAISGSTIGNLTVTAA